MLRYFSYFYQRLNNSRGSRVRKKGICEAVTMIVLLLVDCWAYSLAMEIPRTTVYVGQLAS
jgi:hypothetical protein